MFVGIIQIDSDHKATTLKTNATVVYLVQLQLLSFTKNFRWFQISHRYTVPGSLPVLPMNPLRKQKMVTRLMVLMENME